MTITQTTYTAAYMAAGSIVEQTSKPGVYYRVTKVNPKNVLMDDEDGKNWRIDRRALTLAPAGTVFNEAARPEVTLGSVVRFTGTTADRAEPGLWVCIKVPNSQSPRGHFAKLGGGDNRFWKVGLGSVEVVAHGEW